MEKTHYSGKCVFLFAFLVVSCVSMASAVYSFNSITNNTSAASIGEDQFFVEVIQAGPKTVTFKFSNIGVLESSMNAIYFDAGDKKAASVKNISKIDNSSDGVKFKKNAKSSKLNGGGVLDDLFSTKKSLTAGINPKKLLDGVDADEYLGLTLKLNKKRTFDDVLADLESGKLQIGILDASGESYINGGLYDPSATSVPPTDASSTSATATVPVPGSVVLAGVGMCLVRFLRFRK